MEYTILKFAALVFIFTVILPTVNVFIQEKAKQKAKEKPAKKDLSFNELKGIKEIYERERRPYYLQARALFNSLCKQGMMHREDAILVRKLLEDSLGDYVHDYDKWKFENEYNRIYVYMKSWHISIPDWERIIDYLSEVYESTEAIKQN